MLMPFDPKPADYREQAIHLREFINTLKEKDADLKFVLLATLVRLEKLAKEKEKENGAGEGI